MTPPTLGMTRREQRREQTLAEIRGLAMEQVAIAGPDGLSLNAVARAMAMSPAAIYRYFDGRDALLADLVVGQYDDLADHLEALAQGAAEPVERLTRVLLGYRGWAIEHPQAYRLIFQTTSGSGVDLARERLVPASTRSMTIIVDALARVAGSDTDQPSWGLTLGFTCWTRLHGVISLELGGHLASAGLDAAELYDAEIRALINTATHHA